MSEKEKPDTSEDGLAHLVFIRLVAACPNCESCRELANNFLSVQEYVNDIKDL